MRYEIHTYGHIVSEALLQEHAKMEDALLLRYTW
jgi:hypothetical protein